MNLKTIPTFKKNIYSEESLLSSNAIHEELRSLGDVVHLTKHNIYAITSYDAVKQALLNSEVFISGEGVSASSFINKIPRETTIESDGDLHKNRKKVLMRPLTRPKILKLRETIKEKVKELMIDLTKKEEIEVVRDFASYLPLSVVSNLVGLSKEGQDKMLEWATAGFNLMGPMNMRTIKSFPKLVFGLRTYANNLAEKDVHPDGWAAGVFAAIKANEITVTEGQGLIIDYVAPSLDTTILATSHMLWQLAKHPETFEEVRANPELIPNVIDEVVRLATPIRGFTRFVKEDTVLNGYKLPKASRVLVLYASANRDAKKYTDPHTFDIHRKAKDHFGFGFGAHHCAGSHLAKLEMEELLNGLCKYVKKIEVEKPSYIVNNTLQGFSEVQGRLIKA